MSCTICGVPLLTRTQELVRNAPRQITYTLMAEKSGTSITWISRFAAGKIPNPGVVTVQALHDYLVSASK